MSHPGHRRALRSRRCRRSGAGRCRCSDHRESSCRRRPAGRPNITQSRHIAHHPTAGMRLRLDSSALPARFIFLHRYRVQGHVRAPTRERRRQAPSTVQPPGSPQTLSPDLGWRLKFRRCVPALTMWVVPPPCAFTTLRASSPTPIATPCPTRHDEAGCGRSVMEGATGSFGVRDGGSGARARRVSAAAHGERQAAGDEHPAPPHVQNRSISIGQLFVRWSATAARR